MKTLSKQLKELEYQYRVLEKSEEFHDETKLQKIIPIPTSNWPKEWKEISYKSYPRLNKIALSPNESILNKKSFFNILKNRKSTRDFKRGKLSKKQLSTLLCFSSGIRNRTSSWDQAKRFYPSAGARYPLEVYPILINDNEIPNGIYHYNVKTSSMEIIKQGSFLKELQKITQTDWIKNASLIIIFSAVFGRNQIKYGDRGYRHIFTESGHAAQNLYLLSSALNLGCCALGGFLDDQLNSLLDLDGINESVINVLVLGFPKNGGEKND